MATLGWMAGCWIVSALGAGASGGRVCRGRNLDGSGGLHLLAARGHAAALRRPDHDPAAVLSLDALALLKHRDTRVVFLTAALFAVPIAAFYPYTPPNLRELGFTRTSAWMSLGEVSEILAMFGLAGWLRRTSG